MGGRAESGFGYSGHRDGELGVRVRARAVPAIWAGIGVAAATSRPSVVSTGR